MPRGDASGFAAVEFVAGLALLVLPIAILVVSLPVWAETQSSARVVVREAARVLAVADDDADGRAAATTMAVEVADNLALELVGGPRFEGSVEGPPGVASEVRATITVRLPLLALPLLADLTAVDWTVEHREPVDAYRSRG